MTIEFRFYYSEATRVNQPKSANQDSMSCCSIERKELYNTSIIKFVSENVSTVIVKCFNQELSVELEPMFMKNLNNYDQHHGFKVLIDIESSDNIKKRIWNILVLFFHEVLVIRFPEKYIPLNIINIDFNKSDGKVINSYLPEIFNKKLGKKLPHPIKIELVGHDEILEVVNKWGENQDPSQPEWDGIITFEGKFKTISFNHTFTIATSDSGDIKIHNEAYQDNEVLKLALEYNGGIQSYTKNNNNLIKFSVNRWFNPLDNKSEYKYKSAEIIANDSCQGTDNNTLPFDFKKTAD